MKDTNENGLVQFLVGIVLLAIGLYMLSQRVYVHHGWSVIHFGSFSITSGIITIPLIIGVVWYFYNPKSLGPKILIILGVIFIVVSLLMNMRISIMRMTLFEYSLVFGFIASGWGLLLKSLFKINNK